MMVMVAMMAGCSGVSGGGENYFLPTDAVLQQIIGDEYPQMVLDGWG
ncbi:MAG: hypothetical protein HY985_09535 [Magnetospirillum sp.]|nr:hypothetical protein [Magnetospirillum sp.]